MGQALLEHFLEGLTITVITPMRQARKRGRARARGADFKCSKTVEVECSC